MQARCPLQADPFPKIFKFTKAISSVCVLPSDISQ
ncbi:hypothetical protein CPL00136_CDS0108 [Salmonella phage vB_SenS-3]|uniref:Uncharacterized protein n=3 Tax=Caudoviricetes TaxID=2731619 RepID=A0A5J6TAY2_9CAUD|nr:hypothetical protein HWC37_gp189 [Salmonella phage vB_SenS_SB13]QFG07645.1 hypothetical protein [Salmonella phage vB_SenS_SB13]